MQEIIDEMKGALPDAIARVSAALPQGFPKHVSDSIFENTEKIMSKI